MILPITVFGVEYATSDRLASVVRAAAPAASASAAASTAAKMSFFPGLFIGMVKKYITRTHSSNK